MRVETQYIVAAKKVKKRLKKVLTKEGARGILTKLSPRGGALRGREAERAQAKCTLKIKHCKALILKEKSMKLMQISTSRKGLFNLRKQVKIPFEIEAEISFQ